MARGEGKCQGCQDWTGLIDPAPVATESPPCGCYIALKRDEGYGVCQLVGGKRVSYSAMIAGLGVCENCQKRRVPLDETTKTNWRQAPASLEEGEEVTEFDERMKRIGDEPIMRVVRHGYAVLGVQGNETVNEHLTRCCDNYLGLLSNRDSEGLNEVERLANALDLESRDLTKHLRGLSSEKKRRAEEQRAARVVGLNFKFDPIHFPEIFPGNPVDGMKAGSSVWAVIADTVQTTLAGTCSSEELTRLSGVLNAPISALIVAGLTYLEKAGLTPSDGFSLEGLPEEMQEAYEAFLAGDVCRVYSARMKGMILPEELDEGQIDAFLGGLASSHPSFAESIALCDPPPPEDATVEYVLRQLKTNGADADMAYKGFTEAVRLPRQFTAIFDALEPLAAHPSPPEEVDGERVGVGDGEGNEEGIVFLVKGRTQSGRGWWKTPANQVVCDRNPATQPLHDESCEVYAARFHSIGFPHLAIGLLLGGVTAAAVGVHLSVVRKAGVADLQDPTNPQKERWAHLGEVARLITKGQLTMPASGPNLGVDLENPVPVCGVIPEASSESGGAGRSEGFAADQIEEVMISLATDHPELMEMLALLGIELHEPVTVGYCLSHIKATPGCEDNTDLIITTIARITGLSEDSARKLYGDLEPQPTSLPPPPPPPTATATTPAAAPAPPASKRSPMTSAMKAAVVAIGRCNPIVVFRVFEAISGLNPLEVLQLVHQEELADDHAREDER